MLTAEDGDRRSGRGDDDIGLFAVFVELVKANGAPTKALRQVLGAIVSAVGYEDGVRTFFATANARVSRRSRYDCTAPAARAVA